MKNKKSVNLEGVSLEENIPLGVEKIFVQYATEYHNFVGEKMLLNGYLIKETQNKCTIALQLKKRQLYSAKLKFIPTTQKWEIDGSIDRWENVEHLLI